MTYCTKANRRKRTKPPPQKRDTALYRQVWRIVDGAIGDCVSHHPEYFRSHDLGTVRGSIAKRVTGAIVSCATNPAWGRSGDAPAADTAAALYVGAVSERGLHARRSVCEAELGGGVPGAPATLVRP